jgi:hypothetical protein
VWLDLADERDWKEAIARIFVNVFHGSAKDSFLRERLATLDKRESTLARNVEELQELLDSTENCGDLKLMRSIEKSSLNIAKIAHEQTRKRLHYCETQENTLPCVFE